MAWYTPILWFLVGVFIGFLVFLAGPILLGPFLPARVAERIGDYYDSLAMATAGRLLLVRRRIGNYTPVPSDFDGEKGGEKVKVDGELHHFFDDIGVMGTFHKKTFGMALEGLAVIGDPFVASMTDYEKPRDESGDWLRENKKGWKEYVPDVEIPNVPLLAEMRNLGYMVPGEMDSKDVDGVEELFKLSQIGFSKPKKADIMILVVAWGVGLGGWLALVYITGGGGASAPSLPGFPAVILP